MLIGLVALMTLLFFGGGNEAIFLNPDIKKNVKTYVKDKDRKKEIYAIIKEIEKEQKKFLKRKSKYFDKKAIALNNSYLTQREAFDALFEEYYTERMNIQSSYWTRDSRIRTIFKEDEWNGMMTAVLEKPDKDKARKGFNKESDKLFEGIINSCKKNIQDEGKRLSAVNAVEGAQMEVNAFVEAYVNQDYDHLETLRSKNASKEDFDKAASQINALRKGVLTHLIDMRFQVISNTTEDEWGKISKELDQLFKKGKGIV
jgi:hypothetical protein